MSKPTVSAAGGAMPAEGRPSHAQTATKIGDELDIIKALVDAAYMASNELTDFHREAMRRLLDETSSKVGWVQKEFTEIYCGGYIDVGKREPAAAASRTPAGKGADDSDASRELLSIVDEIDEVRYLVDAAWMAADSLTKEECNAMKAVTSVAFEKLTAARDRLNAAPRPATGGPRR